MNDTPPDGQLIAIAGLQVAVGFLPPANHENLWFEVNNSNKNRATLFMKLVGYPITRLGMIKKCTNLSENISECVMTNFCEGDDIMTNGPCYEWCVKNPAGCDSVKQKFCAKEENKNHAWCKCINSIHDPDYIAAESKLSDRMKALPLFCKSMKCNNGVDLRDMMILSTMKGTRCPSISEVNMNTNVLGTGNTLNTSQAHGEQILNTGVGSSGSRSNSIPWKIIGGVMVGFLFLLIIVAIVIIIRKQPNSYDRDDEKEWNNNRKPRQKSRQDQDQYQDQDQIVTTSYLSGPQPPIQDQRVYSQLLQGQQSQLLQGQLPPNSQTPTG
jgi:hypothetical protein